MMYTYYAMAARGVRFPKAISAGVTSLQLLQMLVGIIVSGKWLMTCSPKSSLSRTPAYAAIIIYMSYAILFGNFFIQTYLVKKPKSVTHDNNNNNNKKSD